VLVRGLRQALNRRRGRHGFAERHHEQYVNV
jgi:hypothetical protein